MQVSARGLVYDATQQSENRKIAFFTSLCALRNGDLLCGFQVGTGKHSVDSTLGICRSRDGGQSWDAIPFAFETVLNGVPGSLSGISLLDAGPDRLLMFATWFDRSEPQRPLFDPESEGILHSHQLMSVSHDNGQTWGPWTTIPTPGLTGTAATGPALQWDDGTIAFAFESFKEFDDPSPPRHGAWITVSRDAGRTFEPPLLVAQDPENAIYYWDQRLCVGPSAGQFTALFWTHDRRAQRDLTVHRRQGTLTGRELALQPIHATTIPGQICAPWYLPDGRLLAFVVDRQRPGTMRLWMSTDDGRTWPKEQSLVVHTHDERAHLHQQSTQVDFAEYWEDMGKWSFGHPAILALNGSELLLAWYAGSPDRMSIHWCRVQIEPVK